MAADLGAVDALGQEREWSRHCVAFLGLEAGPVDGPAVETRRSAGLEAAAAQAESLQALAE